LAELQGELYEDNVNTINGLNNINNLNGLFDNIKNDKIMTPMQIGTLLQIINGKILKIRQEKEFNELKTGIENERDTTKLEVDWENKISTAKYLSEEQKNDLHRLRNDRKWDLKGETTFEKFKKDIENEGFINNLLDGKLHDTLIENNALLSKQQKTQLHELRIEQISKLTNKIYDELRNNIKNDRIVSRLEDKGYYDSRISEIRENFLTNRRIFDLHVLRRHQLDKLRAETEDEMFDTLSQLLDLTEDLDELKDEAQITSDIKNLNQTLLTNERYIDRLDKKRKIRYNDNLYDNIQASIDNEKQIKVLQDDWKIKIDTEID
ncbi:20001_t:CDS:1, partial [Gigaspora margarita]